MENNMQIPNAVSINEINQTMSLSPKRYGTISIKRKKIIKVGSLLNQENPYVKGDEPGSITYVKKSKIRFLRNSCINRNNIYFLRNKLIYLNPNYDFSNMVSNLDVLLCKDANIGDCCLYINEDEGSEITVFSSGILKLNFKDEKFKYFCIAFFKDDYFLQQLDLLTPKGSTIRHSGDLFMECYVPDLRESEEWVYDIFESLVKNIAYSEKISYDKLSKTQDLIDRELMTQTVNYSNPDINKLLTEGRLDAGIYSESVFQVFENIRLYKYGYSDLESYGFKLKRGPNLAKRDLGRSIQTKQYRPNYHVLIYPSDISDGGYIEETSYLGARNPVWFLENKNILFSAEGTVGKTFIICDEKLKFTTNFHGMIIYPKDKSIDINKSIFLGLFLNYLRYKGVFDKLSVGGQGGSFAVGYWNLINIPNFPDDVIGELAKIYNNDVQLDPFHFSEERIKDAGIFQLNNFRILCNAILKQIVNDIKLDKLMDLEYYRRKFLND